MRGLILCGGHGTRLRPLTNIFNKNLLPVGRKPMVEYSIEKMAKAGIEEICIITSPHHVGSLVELCRSGKQYGVDITYRIQDAALGISHGISLAENFARNDDLMVILGDNLFEAGLEDIVKFHSERFNNHAYVLVKEVPDPERFGVVEYEHGKVVNIVEKPAVAPSNDAVIGVYVYPTDVFDQIRKLTPSARGELEVTDLNNLYLSEGRLKTHKIEGFWTDAGTHESLKLANEWAYSKD